MVFEPYLHSCILTEKVNFAILWTPGVLSIQPCPPGLGADVAQIVFELMIFIMTWWNALDRPLPQHAKMAKVMYRDGSIYFFVSGHHVCGRNQLTSVRFYLVDIQLRGFIHHTHISIRITSFKPGSVYRFACKSTGSFTSVCSHVWYPHQLSLMFLGVLSVPSTSFSRFLTIVHQFHLERLQCDADPTYHKLTTGRCRG